MKCDYFDWKPKLWQLAWVIILIASFCTLLFFFSSSSFFLKMGMRVFWSHAWAIWMRDDPPRSSEIWQWTGGKFPDGLSGISQHQATISHLPSSPASANRCSHDWSLGQSCELTRWCWASTPPARGAAGAKETATSKSTVRMRNIRYEKILRKVSNTGSISRTLQYRGGCIFYMQTTATTTTLYLHDLPYASMLGYKLLEHRRWALFTTTYS